MAIPHCSAKTISRSLGRSICAAAAYRSGGKIKDKRTGIIYDFTRKGGVLHSEIFVREGSPSWTTNRAELWNRAEQAEDKSTRRATATTARELIIALPHELDRYAQRNLAREFAQYLVITYGVAVDLCIHAPGKDADKRNDHAHLLLTDRRITEAGFADKVRELNIANGGRENIGSIREQWAKITNLFLERAGVHEKIDHRSYKSQGIDREATTHLGVAATALERRGVATKRGDRNRVAREINALREEFEKMCETMLALELAETYEVKETAEIEAIEEADAVTITELITVTRSTFATQDVDTTKDKASNSNGFDPARTDGPTTDLSYEATALSVQHRLDQQTSVETPKQPATKMTLEDIINKAKKQVKEAKEHHGMLLPGHISRDRDRCR